MRTRWFGGALLAAFAAGPVFVLHFYLVTASYQRDWRQLGALPLVLLFASVFGAVVALVPAIAGAASLAMLGRNRAAARHPMTWATAGLVIGAVVGTGFLAPTAMRWQAAELFAACAPFGMSGAMCALLARWRTRWTSQGLSYDARSG